MNNHANKELPITNEYNTPVIPMSPPAGGEEESYLCDIQQDSSSLCSLEMTDKNFHINSGAIYETYTKTNNT